MRQSPAAARGHVRASLQASPLSQHSLSHGAACFLHRLLCALYSLHYTVAFGQPLVDKRLRRPTGRQCPRGPRLLVSDAGHLAAPH